MKIYSFYKKIFLLSFLFTCHLVFSNDLTTPSEKQNEEIPLPKIITYIESPIVEQRIVFNKDEIEKKHSDNLTNFLQSSGIQILSYGSYGLESKPSIRGFTDETIRVVIDGVCVNNAQYGTFDFSSININDIEKIEIKKGGFSEDISGEGSVAGTIYITTKQQILGHHFSIESSIKTFFNTKKIFDTFSQEIGYKGQISENTFLKTNIKGTIAQNAYPFINYKNKISIRENSEVYDAQGNLKLSHFFGNGNNWNLSNSSYIANKNIPGPETSSSFGLQKDFDNNLSFGLSIPSLNNFLKIDSNVSWLSNTRFYEENSDQSKHYVNSFIISSCANFYKYSKFQQTAGIFFNFTHLNSTNDGIHNLLEGTLNETSKIKLNDFFSIIIPLSIKFSGENIAFIPKIGFSSEFKFIEFLLNGYRMIQFPNMDDLYWGETGMNSGNPNLSPETGWGAEFTINLKNKYFPFSFCIYTNYYENKIQWSASNTGKWAPQNIASAFYLGFDFSTEKTFFKILTTKINLEYLYNELLDKSNKLTYGNRIMWTPDFIASFILSLNTKPIYISVEMIYTGKKYTSNLNTYYIEPYYIINLQAELNIWKKIKPYLKIDNILDVDYDSVPDYPMPGISCTLGLKTNF